MFNLPLFSFPTLSTAFKVIVCLMYSGWHGLGGPDLEYHPVADDHVKEASGAFAICVET